MKQKAPSFWQNKHSLAAYLLSPLSWLYQAAHNIKQKSVQPYKSLIPVICIGNLTAGGTGKTPAVKSLIQLLKDEGLCSKPCILSRGYGGTKDRHLVSEKDGYTDIGDEPELLARTAPVIISKDRGAGAQIAEEQGFDLILMDDGFQNMTLEKDISFLVVDGALGFGNKQLLPAGPLREPIAEGLKRTDAVIILNEDTYGIQNLMPQDMPCFQATIKTDFIAQKERNYIGFCGIGYPAKFKKTLEEQDINLIDFIAYPDHYKYTQENIKKLIDRAISEDTRLITTEKDAVRLRDFPELVKHLDILPIHLEWQAQEKLLAFLKERLKK